MSPVQVLGKGLAMVLHSEEGVTERRCGPVCYCNYVSRLLMKRDIPTEVENISLSLPFL